MIYLSLLLFLFEIFNNTIAITTNKPKTKPKPSLSPNVSDKKPMAGGPIKKPVYPMEVAIEIPADGLMFLRFPADENTIGTIVERPNPTKKKPINVLQTETKDRAIAKPKIANKASININFCFPNLSVK